MNKRDRSFDDVFADMEEALGKLPSRTLLTGGEPTPRVSHTDGIPQAIAQFQHERIHDFEETVFQELDKYFFHDLSRLIRSYIPNPRRFYMVTASWGGSVIGFPSDSSHSDYLEFGSRFNSITLRRLFDSLILEVMHLRIEWNVRTLRILIRAGSEDARPPIPWTPNFSEPLAIAKEYITTTRPMVNKTTYHTPDGTPPMHVYVERLEYLFECIHSDVLELAKKTREIPIMELPWHKHEHRLEFRPHFIAPVDANKRIK